MWESDRAVRPRGYPRWAPVLVGLLISLAQVRLVSAAWESCDLTGSTGLSTTSLYALGLPALTFLNWLLIALPAEVWLHKDTTAINRWVLAIVTSAVLIGAETIVVAHFIATPSEPVSTTCAHNVPHWWPEEIPI